MGFIFADLTITMSRAGTHIQFYNSTIVLTGVGSTLIAADGFYIRLSGCAAER